MAIDGEFPALEYLCIKSSNNDDSSLILPETFKAPRLRYFALGNATDCPGTIRSPPPTPRFQSIDTIGQCSRRCGIQLWRYVPFYVYQLLGEQGPFSTGHLEYLFMSSTMIHFSRYSMSVSRYFQTKTRLTPPKYCKAENGADSGTGSRKFVEGGGTLYSP